MHSPREEHFEVAYRILKYLKRKPGRGLIFENHGHSRIETYTDADWAGSITDRRCKSNYCTCIGGNLVTWRSKMQTVVARSSAEAEFRAIAHGIYDLLWLKKLLEDLKVTSPMPMKLYCDKKATINIAHNPVQHDRTKHIKVYRHFTKEKLNGGLICMPCIPTVKQLANVFTKGLHNGKFDSITRKLGMKDIFKPA